MGHDVCKEMGHMYMPQTTMRVLDEEVRAWVQESVMRLVCARCGETKNLMEPDEGDTEAEPDFEPGVDMPNITDDQEQVVVDDADDEPIDYSAGDEDDDEVDPTKVS